MRAVAGQCRKRSAHLPGGQAGAQWPLPADHFSRGRWASPSGSAAARPRPRKSSVSTGAGREEKLTRSCGRQLAAESALRGVSAGSAAAAARGAGLGAAAARGCDRDRSRAGAASRPPSPPAIEPVCHLYLHGVHVRPGERHPGRRPGQRVGGRPAKVISADYRLAPSTVSGAVDDALPAYQALLLGQAQRPAGQATRVPRTTDHRRPATGGDDHEQPGVIMSTSITELIDSFYEAFCGKTELLNAVLTDDWDDIPLGPGQEPRPRRGEAPDRRAQQGLQRLPHRGGRDRRHSRGEEGNGMVGACTRCRRRPHRRVLRHRADRSRDRGTDARLRRDRGRPDHPHLSHGGLAHLVPAGSSWPSS